MARHNIHERRAYVKSLLDSIGEVNINIRAVARMWDSSPPAIQADIAAGRGQKDPYHKPQWAAQNFRAARLGIDGRLTEQDWLKILDQYGSCCANCAATSDLVIDHVIPLSRGGTNTRENVQPLCRSCNSSKRDKTPDEWVTARENGKRGGRPRKN